MKLFELVEFFTDTDELDGLSGNGLDAQRSSAAGVAVELCKYYAVEFQPLIELLRRVDGILAGHCIAD